MTGQGTALITVARLDAQIREWIEKWGSGAASERARVVELQRLQALLDEGKSLIQAVRADGARTSDTELELQSYSATLQTLEPLILQQEIAARMRQSQIERAQLQLVATSAWATRVRQIG